MRWWLLGLCAVGLCLTFRFGCATEVVTADETDALASGAVFAQAIRSGAPLKTAFAPEANNPRAKRLRHKRHRRAGLHVVLGYLCGHLRHLPELIERAEHRVPGEPVPSV